MKFPLLIFSFFGLTCLAQKQLSIKEAEEFLQKNNLELLANKYNISAAKAAVIQAKIWEQPFLSGEFNALNPQENRVFDIGSNGQKGLAIQQLIYLGGKKNNEINFAKSNVAIAELEFEQLLRNLKFQLNQNFYSVYFDKQKVKSFDIQITILDTLIKNYSLQASKGNIPLNQVVRLQSLVLNIKNEKNNLQKEILEKQQNLSLLTGLFENIEPYVIENLLIDKFQNKTINKANILNTSLENNIEFLSANKITESKNSYLKWQKSLAVPDITTGLSYDQRGGAFQNQINLTLGIPLPLWNKNKGNIKIAEAQLQQSIVNRDIKKIELESKVEIYYQLWYQQAYQFQNIDKTTISNLEEVYKGMISNFQKRNISMLEFTDFMESYNQSIIQLNEIKKTLVLSGLNLNYITNKDLF